MRATPRAPRSVLLPAEGHFAARLKAPPVEGAANDALVALVAEVFGVSKRAVTLIAGDRARMKRLRIAGDAEALAKIAASLYQAGP